MLWTCISSSQFAPSILAHGFPSLCPSLWHDVLLLGVRFLCWVNLSQKRTDYWFISGYLQIITLRLPLQDTLQAARRSPRSRSLHLCNKYKKYRGFSLKSEKHSIFIKTIVSKLPQPFLIRRLSNLFHIVYTLSTKSIREVF